MEKEKKTIFKLKYCIISRLNRIKKKTEMGLLLLKSAWNSKNCDVFLDPQRIRVPEKSSSLASAILNRNLAAVSRKFHENLLWTLELNPKEQISTLTSEILIIFVGKISPFLLNQEQNRPFWSKKICFPRKNKAVRKRTRKIPIEN